MLSFPLFSSYNNGMNEREKMLKLCDYGVPFSGDDEDRACVAVAFAWAWQDFPVETDGESRPGNIIFKPADVANAKAFTEEFVPALNAELAEQGFRQLTQYGSGEYYWDLDDPEDLPNMMEMVKFLRRHDIRFDSMDDARAMGKVAMAAKVRELNGSRYFHFDTFGKLVSFRDERGFLCSP